MTRPTNLSSVRFELSSDNVSRSFETLPVSRVYEGMEIRAVMAAQTPCMEMAAEIKPKGCHDVAHSLAANANIASSLLLVYLQETSAKSK